MNRKMKLFLDSLYEHRNFVKAMEDSNSDRRTLRKYFKDEWFVNEIIFLIQLLQYEALFTMAEGAIQGSVKAATVLMRYEQNLTQEEKEKVLVEIINKEFNLLDDMQTAAKTIQKVKKTGT